MIDSQSFTHHEYYRCTGTLSEWRIIDLLDYQDSVSDKLANLPSCDINILPNIKARLLRYVEYIPADKLDAYNKVLEDLSDIDQELIQLNDDLEAVSEDLV